MSFLSFFLYIGHNQPRLKSVPSAIPCLSISLKTIVSILVILVLGISLFVLSLCLFCRVFHSSHVMPSIPDAFPFGRDFKAWLTSSSVTIVDSICFSSSVVVCSILFRTVVVAVVRSSPVARPCVCRLL